MKTCTSCRVSKPRSEFCKRKSSPDGVGYECRGCASRRYKGWRVQSSRQQSEVPSTFGVCELSKVWPHPNPLPSGTHPVRLFEGWSRGR